MRHDPKLTARAEAEDAADLGANAPNYATMQARRDAQKALRRWYAVIAVAVSLGVMAHVGFGAVQNVKHDLQEASQ